jgi:hypothetical protein
MNSSRSYQSIAKIVAAYKTRLSAMGEDDFVVTPPIGGWSYSEVYVHIFDSSSLSLMATQNAIKGMGKDEPTHFAVKMILFFGMLPPGKRYKVPSKLSARVKKINLQEAAQFISTFERELEAVYPLLKSADPRMKIRHPRLGFLNAKQWMRFIEIHLKHHLKQIARIEKSFG